MIPDATLFNPDQLRSPAPALFINFGDTEKQLSFDQLAGLIIRTQKFLVAKGVQTGTHVVLDISAPFADLVVFLALSYLGVGAYRPLGKSALEDAVIDKICVRHIIQSEISPQSRAVYVAVKALDFTSPESAVRSYTDSEILDLPWLLRSSSGTTGTPKIFVTRRRDMLSRRHRYYDAIGIGTGDRFLSLTPIRFGAARQRIFYALSAGASVVVTESMGNVQRQVAFINDLKISHLYCVPLHLEILCNFAEKNHRTQSELLFPNLKCLETTSSLVTPVLREKVTKLLTRNFVIAYSVGETGHITSTRKSRESDLNLNDIGVPVDGINLGIYDNQGIELSQGATGRIGVTITDKEFAGYIGPGTSSPSGIFFPGDLGYISTSGNLIFQGREDDLMIFNGINIFPHEIESAIKTLPEVADVVAFPVPSQLHYHIPCAAVILNHPIEESELLKKCRSLLGARSPHILLAVDHFPKNPMGKILRRELQTLALDKVNRANSAP